MKDKTLKIIIERMSLMFLLFLLASFSLVGQNVLSIEIRNLKSNTGKVFLEISDGENNFIKSLSKEIEKQACIFTIDKLQEGKYSFRLFHDENNNGKLDTNWIGIPTEGYGFSNNAKSSFGPPAFKKTIFDLKGKVLQKCDLSYF